MFYEIMHRESCVAQLSTTGECKVCLEDFMPFDLVLVESDDFDERINNVTNFYYWCASRMLTLDRTYAKEILNSIGASQSVTDRERAQIALSYHCLSLLDVFWVKEENEKVRFEDINLAGAGSSRRSRGLGGCLQGAGRQIKRVHPAVLLLDGPFCDSQSNAGNIDSVLQT